MLWWQHNLFRGQVNQFKGHGLSENSTLVHNAMPQATLLALQKRRLVHQGGGCTSDIYDQSTATCTHVWQHHLAELHKSDPTHVVGRKPRAFTAPTSQISEFSSTGQQLLHPSLTMVGTYELMTSMS